MGRGGANDRRATEALGVGLVKPVYGSPALAHSVSGPDVRTLYNSGVWGGIWE